MTADDMDLVRAYARSHSEEAFSALVERHIHLVYSVAMRRVADTHLAEEITQAVFIILARKASALGARTILPGWLCRTAHYVSANALTTRRRRQQHEQEALMQQSVLNEPESGHWNQIAPLLEDALARLNKKDYDAVVLRFFENRSFGEVGHALGIREDTARMRIARALEKLRKYYFKRGVDSTTAVIAGAISANSIQMAPAGLAKSVSAVAIAKGTAASASTLTLIKGALKLMAWTKAKTAIVAGAAILLFAGTTAITVKQVELHRDDDSWRAKPNFDSRTLDHARPQVKILPTKFPRFGGWGEGDGRIMGLGAPVNYVVQAAWNYGSHRTVFSTDIPKGRYDFIANLPSGNREALQQQIKKQFGLTGRIETIDTNVLLLKVKFQNAPGLVASTSQLGGMSSSGKTFQCEGLTISTVAGFLESTFGVPVIDQTGLTGAFDITLKWRDDNDLKQVLASKLGLELVPGQAPVQMLVVDKVN